jgi:hypothetical protein
MENARMLGIEEGVVGGTPVGLRPPFVPPTTPAVTARHGRDGHWQRKTDV